MSETEKVSRLIPIPRWNEFHPWPPQGGLRHLAFHRQKNGFQDAFVKVGRRILVKEDEFLKIAADQRRGA